VLALDSSAVEAPNPEPTRNTCETPGPERSTASATLNRHTMAPDAALKSMRFEHAARSPAWSRTRENLESPSMLLAELLVPETSQGAVGTDASVARVPPSESSAGLTSARA